MQLINIGFGNIVSANRIIAIVSPESAPIKRIVQVAKDEGMAVDATYGRRTRAVIIMDSGHVVLSAVQPETVAGRLDKEDTTNNTVSSDEDEDGSNEPEETPAEELQPEEPETEKAAETEPAQEQPVEETPVEKETMEEK